MSDQVQFAPLEPSNGAGPGDADKPVDLLVNGKPIARGEVVVIDEEFGLRITEVASPRHGRPDAA